MCPCSYCQGVTPGAMPGCRCEMCSRASERASINRNLAALAGFAVAGDVRGYGAFAPPTHPAMIGVRSAPTGVAYDPRTGAHVRHAPAPRHVLSNYGQRDGGCGCNGSR